MNSGPRHAREKEPRRATALLRAGLTVSAAGAALAAGGGAAHADEPSRAETSVGNVDTRLLHDPRGTLDDAVTYGVDLPVDVVSGLQLNPLAKTGTDPTANSVGTQIADFRPISTGKLTAPLSEGASLRELPLTQGLL